MLSFYKDKLGLPVSKIHPGKGYEPLVDWVRFEPDGGTAIELFAESRNPRSNVLPFPRNNALVIAFQVDDIDTVYAKLRSQGVEFPKGIGEQEWGATSTSETLKATGYNYTKLTLAISSHFPQPFCNMIRP